MLGYLMRNISPTTSWPYRLRHLIEDFEGLNTAAMGFPEDWQALPLWRERR